MSVEDANRKVILGLSGGVDSTAAALILKERGYDVTGLYFNIHENDKSGEKKAVKVAEELGIDLIIKDISQRFNEIVVSDFIREYSKGRTPNPCTLCNPEIKFKTLIDEADRLGAEFIATGHYADTTFSSIQNCHVIRVSANRKKDQSYMLYRLPANVIERLILPLSDYDDKEHIRKIAREKSMSNSEDKDSQEICFLNEGEDYTSFLKKHGVKSVEGNFIDKDSNVLGRHKGIINYTIGQRKGLGIALGKPAFVTDIDAENNTVTLGENVDLFNRQVICDNVFFTSTSSSRIPEFIMGKRLYGKIRYAAKPAECSVEEYKEGMIKVLFDEPQRAATGGQSLVLYMDDEVCGGGLITIERK